MDFEQMCTELEQSTPERMDALLASLLDRVMPKLKQIGVEAEDGVQLLVSFMIASCYADGAVNQDEYELMHPVLQALFGEEVDLSDAKKMVDSFAADQNKLKAETDKLIDMLGEVSEDLKMEIVLMCLIVCAIDHKITDKEKAYVGQLLA